VPLVQATTASFDALKAYSEGVDLSSHGQRTESIPLFQRAIELDPNFAMAYADLAGAYYSLNQGTPEVAAISKAYELRNTVSEREKLFIVASYHRSVTRDLNEQVRNLELWSRTYPLDAQALVNLCNAENYLGRYPLAVDAGRRELRLNPHSEAAYVVLARALRHADRLDEAHAIDKEALAKGLAGDATHGDLLQIAFARNDAAEVAREIAWSEQKPSELMFQLRAEIAFSEGRVQQGRELFEQLIALARRHGLQDYTAAARARMLADFGLEQEARAVLEQMPSSNSPGDYLFTSAEVGDRARVEAILARDLAEGPSDTLLIDVLAPEVRAALALRDGKPDAAIAVLHSALPYDLRNFDVPYLRGIAYLTASDAVNAALEFRKILDHPGVDPVSPYLALARLGLARAWALSGKGAEARREYEAFLAAWKNADSDLPQLRQARDEYARIGARPHSG
jgi:tetratricopeptide (TPR) repeat protein